MSNNGKKEKEKPLKSFIWQFFDKEEVKQFETFRLLALVKSSSVEMILMYWIKAFLKKNNVNFTLLNEADSMKRLQQDGLETTRVTLKKYRDMNVLVNDEGEVFWYTDGHNLAYNYEELKKFVQNRKLAGVEKLVA